MYGLTPAGLLKISVTNLRVNWQRSALAILGMVFGTGAVIATLSSNEGAKSYVKSELAKLGTNILTVATESQVRLTEADLAVLQTYSEHLKSVALVRTVRSLNVTRGTKSLPGQSLYGVEVGYYENLRLFLRRGRYPAVAEAQGHELVCVLGSKIARSLFGKAESLGGTFAIEVNGARFPMRVIGELADKGVNSGIDFDSGIYVAPELVRTLSLDPPETQISAILRNDDDAEKAKQDIYALLKPRFPAGTAAKIYDARETLERTQSIWKNQNLVGILLALICLLTGGVGIMNVMLLSVQQRKREIGLRKAIGATNGNISGQFLVEAVIICLLGGILGIASGWLFGRQVAALLGQWEARTSPFAILVALGFAAGTGIFFGLVPALKASRTAPYDALRG